VHPLVPNLYLPKTPRIAPATWLLPHRRTGIYHRTMPDASRILPGALTACAQRSV